MSFFNRKEKRDYPLLGYRCWRIDPETNTLRAVMRSDAWNPGVNIASCHKGHQSPDPLCHCGFNAFYMLPKEFMKKQSNGDPLVWGTVAGAKKLELYRGGWHAAEAQIIGLLLPSDKNSQEKVFQIAEKYKLPCVNSQEELIVLGETYAKPIDSSKTSAKDTELAAASSLGLGTYHNINYSHMINIIQKNIADQAKLKNDIAQLDKSETTDPYKDFYKGKKNWSEIQKALQHRKNICEQEKAREKDRQDALKDFIKRFDKFNI